jgi:hypothetical protein
MDNVAVVKDILAHHGVKGMHWGVRRSGRSSDVSVATKTSRSGKAVVKTSGGHALPAHPDAVAARVVKQKLQKSGTHALSNEELQKLINRQNLESQVSKNGSTDSTYQHGVKAVSEALKKPETKLALKGAKTAARSKHVRRILATVGTSSAIALGR